MKKKNESNEFWKTIIYKNGKLDEKQVLAELSYFYYIMDQVPKVYSEITGGKFSKLMWSAEDILDEFNELYIHKESAGEDVKDMIERSKTLKELVEELKDYFEF